MLPSQKPFRGTQLNRTHPLAKGCVGCWLFNEMTGETVFDSSGNGNNGVLENGVAWGSDGLDYDGVDDYVDCGSGGSLTLSNNISIEVWAKRSGTGGWQAMVTKKGGSGIYDRNYEFAFAGVGMDAIEDSVGLFFYTGSAWAAYSSDIAYTDTDWHYYEVVHTFGDGTTTKLYRDGIEISGSWTTGTGSEIPITGNYPLYVGATQPATDIFNGSIRSINIYNQLKSAEETAWLYREPYAMFEPAFSLGALYAALPPALKPMWYYNMLRRRNR